MAGNLDQHRRVDGYFSGHEHRAHRVARRRRSTGDCSTDRKRRFMLHPRRHGFRSDQPTNRRGRTCLANSGTITSADALCGGRAVHLRSPPGQLRLPCSCFRDNFFSTWQFVLKGIRMPDLFTKPILVEDNGRLAVDRWCQAVTHCLLHSSTRTPVAMIRATFSWAPTAI